MINTASRAIFALSLATALTPSPSLGGVLLDPTGFTENQAVMVREAFAHAELVVASEEFLQCLKSSFMTETGAHTAEEIIERLTEQHITKIRRVNKGSSGGSGCASVPTYPNPSNPQVIKISKNYIAGLEAVRASGGDWKSGLADTIVHEAAHTRSFSHAGINKGYRGASVPYQVGLCVNRDRPYGPRRDAESTGEMELSKVGGLGGQPFSLRCPAGEQVVGMTVSSSSRFVNRMRFSCSDGSRTPFVGEYGDSIRTVRHECDRTEVMTGFFGASTAMVNGLYGRCTPLSDVTNADPDAPLSQMSYLGGTFPIGEYFERKCPIGQALVGALGRSGARIDQIRWLCEDPTEVEVENPYLSSLKGTRTGNAKISQCSARGVVESLYGQLERRYGEVAMLGVTCAGTNYNQRTRSLTRNGDRMVLEPSGGDGRGLLEKDHLFDIPCPPGMAMVGLRGHFGARVDRIGGICAPVESWASGSTLGVQLAFQYGAFSGTSSTAQCPVGHFLAGVKTWENRTRSVGNDNTIHGVQLICRDLNPKGIVDSRSSRGELAPL